MGKTSIIIVKLEPEIAKVVEETARKLGLKKAELCRLALYEYLKSLSLLKEVVKEKTL